MRYIIEWGVFGWTVVDLAANRTVLDKRGHFYHYGDMQKAVRLQARLERRRNPVCSHVI